MSRILGALPGNFSADNDFGVSSLPAPMEEGELLARYLFQSNQFNSSGRVKPAAFLPYPRLETSVFRKSRMAYSEYEASQQHVSAIKGKDIKAIAVINNDLIPSDLGLGVVPEESDFDWHANIVGWPSEKHEQKLIAQKLSALSMID